MPFVVSSSVRTAGGRAGPVVSLGDESGTVRAEVWPSWGFNCLRWEARQPDGSWRQILYTAPDWESNTVPTRSGHPILFPFPGRLRDGRLPAAGGSFLQLPLNDSTKQHAIHGFTPRNAWRLTGAEGHDAAATVSGAFRLSQDLPEARDNWPVDFELRATYTLSARALRIDVELANDAAAPLPFGIGYHPYFRLPGVSVADVGGHVLRTAASEVWEADANNLPTGRRIEVPPALDFRSPRPIGATSLDHVLTGVRGAAGADGLVDLAELSHPAVSERLTVRAAPVFRELVLFTPPHRQAVAIEPYTCSADASHLAERGIDSGWRVLAPGEVFRAGVEYCYGA